jgi:ATP-binding cassette subfamily B protein
MLIALRQARFYARAVSYFRGDWPLVILWMALIGLSTGLSLLSPWPMAVLADSVLGRSATLDFTHRMFLAALPQSTVGRIVGLAVIGLLIKLLGDLFSVAMMIVTNQINYNGLLRIRCDLFRKLQALSLSYHRSRPQGDAIYRLNSDVYGAQTVLSVLVSAVVAMVNLVAMTVILSQRNVALTFMAFSIAPPLAMANIVFGRRMKARTIACKENDSRFTAVVQRAMACIGLVQAFGREDDEFRQFHGTIRETITAWWGLHREQILYQLITAVCFGLGTAAIFGYGGYLVSRNKLSMGDLLIFTGYLAMLWGPLCQLTGFTASLQGGATAIERVFEVLDRDVIIADKPGAIALPVRPRTLELSDLHFAYSTGTSVLAGLSVKIMPGQTVAFVGSSGVGKSTLLNLLPRFYDPTSGSITLDGIDARDVRLKDLRQHVALVLQESVMLPTSIADNIAYGRPGATREQITAAAQLAGAAEFIDRQPDGYDTLLFEGGANLSGGQRQRISIARAVLTEAPFVVLDEPTSALDPLHERRVTEALDSLKGKRTIILVSHRLSTVINCDQIFVMDNGRIVEAGTHKQLLLGNGLYARMADQQLQKERRAA